MENKNFKSISFGDCQIIHTFGTSEYDDVSFQKSMWDQDKKIQNHDNAINILKSAGINNTNMVVIGFDQEQGNLIRHVSKPDLDVFEKQHGNGLITSEPNLVLMGWAADCCLVGLVAEDAKAVAVMHVSVQTLKAGIISSMVQVIRRKVNNGNIDAFVGACAGKCCYTYGKIKAEDDFRDHQNRIVPIANYTKYVALDLNGAIVDELEANGVKVHQIFDEQERCTICTKDADGNYKFPSYRRDKIVQYHKEKHINGQYGLFVVKKS